MLDGNFGETRSQSVPWQSAPGRTSLPAFEKALDQARSLLEYTITEYGNGADQSLLPTDPDESFPSVSVQRMVKNARRDVRVVIPSDSSESGALCGALGDAALPDLESNGVRIRFLSSERSLDLDCVRLTASKHADDFRVVESSLDAAVIVDDQSALLRTSPDGGSTYASVAVDHVVAPVFGSLFDGVFTNAGRLSQHCVTQFSGQRLICVLELLRAGYPDEAAARELGISLRTYRRRVAAIMRSLGAKSRFQAGARAVHAGLLPYRP